MGGSGKVRVGVIGAGSWAVSNHIPVLAARNDVELVSVVRKGAEALQFVQDRFGFAHASEDYRDALEQGLDAVVVAGPSVLHHEHAKAALEAGANVLCEKPVTIDPAEAWDLCDTAERLGRHYLISFGWHYGPLGIEAKRLMTEAGGVGDIEHVMVQMASGTRELLKATGAYEGSATDLMPDWDTWTDPEVSGGGYAPAQLSHAMGMALWLTGDRAAQVFGFMNNVGARVDLQERAIAIRYASGATGTLSGASCPGPANADDSLDEIWPRHQLLIRIYGSAGQLILDFERDFLWHYTGGDDNKVDLPPSAGLYTCEGPAQHAGGPDPGPRRAEPLAGRRGSAVGGGGLRRLRERAPGSAGVGGGRGRLSRGELRRLRSGDTAGCDSGSTATPTTAISASCGTGRRIPASAGATRTSCAAPGSWISTG